MYFIDNDITNNQCMTYEDVLEVATDNIDYDRYGYTLLDIWALPKQIDVYLIVMYGTNHTVSSYKLIHIDRTQMDFNPILFNKNNPYDFGWQEGAQFLLTNKNYQFQGVDNSFNVALARYKTYLDSLNISNFTLTSLQSTYHIFYISRKISYKNRDRVFRLSPITIDPPTNSKINGNIFTQKIRVINDYSSSYIINMNLNTNQGRDNLRNILGDEFIYGLECALTNDAKLFVPVNLTLSGNDLKNNQLMCRIDHAIYSANGLNLTNYNACGNLSSTGFYFDCTSVIYSGDFTPPLSSEQNQLLNYSDSYFFKPHPMIIIF